ncbi:MAG: BaiN/RdsA family NAD(P)/FAD-dependent oxidoreductase [Saccharofermentanales bacterium]
MSETNSKQIIAVIGGGPAGLMAAGTAAASGASVLLFEKNSQCGRKLLITGSGKCNVTNNAPFDFFLDQYPENKKFLYSAFKQFFVEDLKILFNRYHLSLIQDDNGKLFPETQQSKSVLDVLLSYCKDQQVVFHYKEPVKEVAKNETGWTIQTDQGSYHVDSVIISTGGFSYPKTGSDGTGHTIAAKLSHLIVPTRPALVPLEISDPDCSSLSGISLKNVIVKLYKKDLSNQSKIIAVQQGDLLFTHFGVSGPPILFLSRWLPSDFDHPDFSGDYFINVDLLPAISHSALENTLLKIFGSTPNRQLTSVLSLEFGIPHAVTKMIVTHCGFKEDIHCQEVTKEYRKKLLAVLKSLCLSISKTRGYQEAMVTAGGVSTKEINPHTMESKLQPGLFFAGEIIDVDGYTGGYNLQAAFSTGYLAGKCAAK